MIRFWIPFIEVLSFCPNRLPLVVFTTPDLHEEARVLVLM